MTELLNSHTLGLPVDAKAGTFFYPHVIRTKLYSIAFFINNPEKQAQLMVTIIKLRARPTYKARSPYCHWYFPLIAQDTCYRDQRSTSTHLEYTLSTSPLRSAGSSALSRTTKENFLAKLLLCTITRFTTTPSYCFTVYS